MKKNSIITTKKLVTLALFTALTYVVSLISFSIFPAAPYLKLDFGNVFILLSGFLFGPVEGIAVCLVKEVLSLINTTTGGVGEIANFIMTSSFIILPSVVYKIKKGFKPVAISLAAACIIGTAVAALVNRFIVFPLYMGDSAPKIFNEVLLFVLLFNLIKTVSISAITLILYKRLSKILKKLEVK